jgi:uncharacterized membrane protein YkoI
LGDVKVPPAAKEHFYKQYPNATHIEWKQEGTDKYEAEFKQDHKHYTATYDAKGTFLESEKELTQEELPVAVLAAAQKIKPNAKLTEFAQIKRADKSVVFEVEIKDKKEKTDFLFTEDGVLTQ